MAKKIHKSVLIQKDKKTARSLLTPIKEFLSTFANALTILGVIAGFSALWPSVIIKAHPNDEFQDQFLVRNNSVFAIKNAYANYKLSNLTDAQNNRNIDSTMMGVILGDIERGEGEDISFEANTVANTITAPYWKTGLLCIMINYDYAGIAMSELRGFYIVVPNEANPKPVWKKYSKACPENIKEYFQFLEHGSD